jgi:hypothetical protein
VRVPNAHTVARAHGTHLAHERKQQVARRVELLPVACGSKGVQLLPEVF